MLQELKVAYHVNREQGEVFTAFELIQSVSSNAAAVTGWEKQLGTLEEGKLADILVIEGADSDAYMQLLKATEKEVELVIINGVARYGSIGFMKMLRIDTSRPLEEITIGKKKKGLYLYSESSPINDIRFGDAVETLKDIMQDLPGFVTRMEEEKVTLMDLGVETQEEFTVELDNEFEIESDIFQDYEPPDVIELLADPPMADSVEFDTAVVEGKEYWARVDAQRNISKELKEWLRECYDQ
jgi:hypothetical protein